MTASDGALIRIVNGDLSEDEVAAVTAVLLGRLARGAAVRHDRESARPAARWRRPERLRTYRNPVSWQ